MDVHRYKKGHSGMSLVEVVIAAAIMVLIFGGLLASFQLLVSLIGKSKAESGALALASERLEYVRSLPYNDVGTVAGIPSGPIPQTRQVTLNGITYNERVLIEYVDGEEDGTGASDVNGIVADYKRVKIEYTWSQRGIADSLSLISNIVPEGIETTVGGGTLVVNVFDAQIVPIEGASVRLYNGISSSTIDVTRFTNVDGVAMFSGAPAQANYEITVTKGGFSTDQTYSATAENTNPTPPHVAVLESQVSTMNFQIDVLSDLAIQTVGVPVTETFTDSFIDGSGIFSFEDTVVSAGAVRLAGGPPYPGTGSVQSVPVSPDVITAWDTFSFELTTSEDTSALVQLYSVVGTSTYSLIPDSVLPGNSTGFATGTISIGNVNTATYPSLALGATLSTTNASSTPSLLSWELGYIVNEPPIANVPVALTSTKTIGTASDGSPVYKYESIQTTDATGAAFVTAMEWDVYRVALNTSAYDIAEACGHIPFVLNPGVSETLKLTLAPDSPHTLRVRVEDGTGTAIPGATVVLTNPGSSASRESSGCGQTFFTGLTAADDYQLSVSAPGFASETIPTLVINGDGVEIVVLSAS